jgi:hypothetical protein
MMYAVPGEMVRTFGFVDEPHGGGGGPIFLDPERQPICARNNQHIKSGDAHQQSHRSIHAEETNPREPQIGSPAAGLVEGLRSGGLTFHVRRESIQLSLGHRGSKRRSGEGGRG